MEPMSIDAGSFMSVAGATERPVEQISTLIVGGGQAGLAMSHMLSKRRCSHLILERDRVAERWRSERWMGLRFQFPNWSLRLPDFPFHHQDPDGFASASEVLGFLLAHADFIAAPVRCGVSVTQLRQTGSRPGFVAETSVDPISAENVVIATGPYQRPVIPSLVIDEDLLQLHASRYAEPCQLPPCAVLVAGSGASGTQIAEELLEYGRRAYLSIGKHRRMPRRYRGHDLMWWLQIIGLDRTSLNGAGQK
jgi:putative flavoprotein involved in K+ transport